VTGSLLLAFDLGDGRPEWTEVALALGFVTWRTRSIWPAVVFHAANNTVTGIL